MFGGGGTNITLIAKAFFKGVESKKKSTNFFIEGNKLYSFGTHYALAIKTNFNGKPIFVLNGRKYSPTTSGHQSTCRSASRECITITLVDCDLDSCTTERQLEKMILEQLLLNKNNLDIKTQELQLKPFYKYSIEDYHDKIIEHNALVVYLDLDANDFAFVLPLSVKKKIKEVQAKFEDAEQSVEKRKQLKLFEGDNVKK